jgi:hypothetical protein
MKQQRRAGLHILHSCKWLVFAGAIIYVLSVIPELSTRDGPVNAGDSCSVTITNLLSCMCCCTQLTLVSAW